METAVEVSLVQKTLTESTVSAPGKSQEVK